MDASVKNTKILASNLAREETNYAHYLITLYLIISLILVVLFIKNLINITDKINKHQHIKKEKATLVLIDEEINPHTFWNYIFINKKEYFNNKIENQLYTHEFTHAIQKHTIDIVIIEFLQILFWINPTYIFLKKAIKLNHEFLADSKAIEIHKDIAKYQHLLLNRIVSNNVLYLTSNFNYLLTKKRLLMMTRKSSKTKILLKKIAIIPFIVVLAVFFAKRIEKESDKSELKATLIEANTLNKTKNQIKNSFREGVFDYGNTLFYVKTEHGMASYSDSGEIVSLSWNLFRGKKIN